MPLNKKGDHYANPAYGKMMEGGGKSKSKMAMEAYGEKAAQYAKMGYKVNKVEVEYAENGFVVKCFWEEPYDKKKSGGMGMAYMEPTVKVFESAKDMAYFVGHVFNEYRHGMSKVSSPRTAIASASIGKSYPGQGSTTPKAPLRNTNKGVKHNPGSHKY